MIKSDSPRLRNLGQGDLPSRADWLERLRAESHAAPTLGDVRGASRWLAHEALPMVFTQRILLLSLDPT